MARPGFMCYLDNWGPIVDDMDEHTIALLLKACVARARGDEEPELTGMAATVWKMLLPSFDRDGERYEQTKLARRYAAYCRVCREKGIEPLARKAWDAARQQDDDVRGEQNTDPCEHMQPNPCEHMQPTANTDTNTIPNTIPNADTNTIPNTNETQTHSQRQRKEQKEGDAGEGGERTVPDESFEQKRRRAKALLLSYTGSS